MLSYLNCSTIEHVTNDDISHIHSYVTTVKQSGKVRDDYVTLGDLMDKYAEKISDESYAKGELSGELKGRIANFVDVLSDLGEVSPEIIERAKALDKDTLKTWTKLAAKSDTMQDFLKSIE